MSSEREEHIWRIAERLMREKADMRKEVERLNAALEWIKRNVVDAFEDDPLGRVGGEGGGVARIGDGVGLVARAFGEASS